MPQIVVVEIRSTASPRPAIGIGFSVSSILPGRMKTATFIVRIANFLVDTNESGIKMSRNYHAVIHRGRFNADRSLGPRPTGPMRISPACATR